MDGTLNLLYFTIMKWKSLPAELSISGAPALHECEPKWSWRRECFEDFDLWIVLGGAVTVVRNGGKSQELVRGEGILFYPGDSIEARHRPEFPVRVFSVHFEMSSAWGRWLKSQIPEFLQFHDLPRLESGIRHFLNLKNMKTSGCEEWMLIQLTALLAQASLESGQRAPDRVELRLRELGQEIAARPGGGWSPEEQAKKCGMSLPQFNRRFRGVMGTSLARYVIVKRVDRACLLLKESVLSIQQIAEALGYADHYYFHRQFRQEVGKTPGDFREGSG